MRTEESQSWQCFRTRCLIVKYWMNKESFVETICLLKAVFVLSDIASRAGTLPLSLKVSAHPGSLFLANQSSFQLWEFLPSATVQQLLNSTFSAVLAVSGILLFSSNRATQFRGEDHLTDSLLAVLILGKLLWRYICCKRCQALWFLCAAWRVYPKQFTNPVSSKETSLQI